MEERYARRFSRHGKERHQTSAGRAFWARVQGGIRPAPVEPRDYEASYHVQEGYAAEERVVDRQDENLGA